MATEVQTAPNDANSRSLKDSSDSAQLGASNQKNMRCPDPSAHHTKNTALQDQASAAALYSTNPPKGSGTRDPLGPDGKLSSASAATSLKHARAQDLPSFPVVGIDTKLSANTAANLANSNKKSPEWWKPEQSAAAGKAALLANDYKMAPLWQPEASTAGSKAALLAHKDGVKLNLWTPEASSHSSSAATIAFGKKGLGPEVDYAYRDDGKNKALVAATGAVSSSGRKRAKSSPAPPPLYPDSQNSAKNALSAATLAHAPSLKVKSPTSPASTASDRLGSGAMEAARIQHSKSISRDMYTSTPPVALEVEEKKRNDALRASAISMAKKMYDVQQQHIDQAAGRMSRSHAVSGATVAQGQQQTTSEEDIKSQAMRYIGVQEAAQRLAAERLAKIAPDENVAFRSYYGYEKPTRSKLSIRRNRNRAQSEPEFSDSDDDELRSRRIRTQMSQLNKSLAEVDAKRDQDRKSLMAAAERKVQAQMLGLDKKVFDETGKMSPAMIEEWDAKARAKAAANSEARMENHGKVHIGHGKYMDQADIDAVAQARIQPTLDEIAVKTEKRRAEEEEQRLEMEEKKRQAQTEKERAADIKAEEKRAKDEEKKAARQEKEAEKEKKAEEKRLAREEKRKSKDVPKLAGAAEVISPTTDAREDSRVHEHKHEHEHVHEHDKLQTVDPNPEHESSNANSPSSPTSPTSPRSESRGIKSFLNKFKRRSKHSAASAEIERPGFIGGAALRGSSIHSNRDSAPTSPHPAPARTSDRRYSDISSIESEPLSPEGRGRSPKRTVSGFSAVSGGTEFEEARDGFNEELAPPPSFTSTDVSAGRKGSPNRDSRFHEVGL